MNKEHILHYLNYHGKVDDKINTLIDECIKEVKEVASFKSLSMKLPVSHLPLKINDIEIKSQDLDFYFQHCNECMIVACTLGLEIDRRVKYYEHVDMAKAVVFDAVSNCFLEECENEYEKSLNLGLHTFRFAPGYGDIPLTLNGDILKRLQADKRLGITLTSSHLMLPMKSIVGMIGIGDDAHKTCLSCIRKESCSLRKGGQRCYVID